MISIVLSSTHTIVIYYVSSHTYSDYDTSLPILLDDVTCSSSDNLLLLCSHRGIGVDNCVHSEDIEITCSTGGLII